MIDIDIDIDLHPSVSASNWQNCLFWTR